MLSQRIQKRDMRAIQATPATNIAMVRRKRFSTSSAQRIRSSGSKTCGQKSTASRSHSNKRVLPLSRLLPVVPAIFPDFALPFALPSTIAETPLLVVDSLYLPTLIGADGRTRMSTHLRALEPRKMRVQKLSKQLGSNCPRINWCG